MNTSDMITLWRGIVSATADFGPEATALRIPLFVDFRQLPGSWKKDIAAIIKAGAQFLTLPRKPGKNSRTGRVLFCFPHGTPSNLNNLLPVAREAHRRGLLGGILTVRHVSTALKEFAGVVPIVLADEVIGELGFLERFENGTRIAKEYRKIWKALCRHLPEFRLAGRRMILVRSLIQSVLYGVVCEKVLARTLPSCIISTSDFWPLEHQLCCQASRRQIPSIVIQHGVLDYMCWPFVSDLCSLWGDAHAAQFLKLGAPPQRLVVLGMPATDTLFARTGSVRGGLTRSRDQAICLILSQTNGIDEEPAMFLSFRQFLTEAMTLLPFITWKVKLHPIEDDSFYREMGDAIYRRLVFHPKHVSLVEAVDDADVVTTLFSTAGLESMIMDRALIVAPATPRVREIAWWPSMGGGAYATTAQDFAIQMTKLTSDSNYRRRQLDMQREFLSRNFANPGHAAERIVDLLESYFAEQNAGTPAR
jgi:hypothetical protein